MDKRRLRTGPTCGLEQVQSPDGIHLEIHKGYCCGPIVRWLSCSVNNDRGLQFRYQLQDRITIPNIDGVMFVPINFGGKSFEDPTCVPLSTKENCTLVVVDTRYSESKSVEVDTHFRTD